MEKFPGFKKPEEQPIKLTEEELSLATALRTQGKSEQEIRETIKNIRLKESGNNVLSFEEKFKKQQEALAKQAQERQEKQAGRQERRAM